MERNDVLIMIGLIAGILLFVDFKPPMNVLDTAIVALAALWALLTIIKWFRKPKKKL
ncbi:hypothetical protein [Paenibacillus tarimensis]|uniref:hypothetical protein n=1 Tax=Paenibacillus tarimensis TaxID=416012 RepID=UPI001F1F1E23|nr:hypothetical protein [Paenibacillus tarimensis]MCF2943180.1 hypothetical protein [Paenibacillus tarimensis]